MQISSELLNLPSSALFLILFWLILQLKSTLVTQKNPTAHIFCWGRSSYDILQWKRSSVCRVCSNTVYLWLMDLFETFNLQSLPQSSEVRLECLQVPLSLISSIDIKSSFLKECVFWEVAENHSWKPQLWKRIIWDCLFLSSSKIYSDFQYSETYLNMAGCVTAISLST